MSDERGAASPPRDERRHAFHRLVQETQKMSGPRQEALAVLWAFQSGRLGERPPDDPIRGMVIVNELIALDAIDAATAYVRTGIRGAADVDGLEVLATALEHLPPANPRIPFRDLPARPVQVVRHPDPGPRPLLLLFCGLAQRFAMPLNLVHRWLGRLDAHVVYLRDLRRVYYLAGIAALADGYDETCAALRQLATSLDASGIVCLGNSAGSFGALSVALDVRATGVLCLSGPTRLDESRRDVERGFAQAKLSFASIPPERFDLRSRFVRTPKRPLVRHVHGADNEVDRDEAANLGGMSGVELLPIPGWERHSVVEALIPSGAFDAHLRWLAGTAQQARDA